MIAVMHYSYYIVKLYKDIIDTPILKVIAMIIHKQSSHFKFNIL